MSQRGNICGAYTHCDRLCSLTVCILYKHMQIDQKYALWAYAYAMKMDIKYVVSLCALKWKAELMEEFADHNLNGEGA